MVHSTSALAISVRSLALRMRRYPGLWEPGATTMVSRTPGEESVSPFAVGRRRYYSETAGGELLLRTVVLINPIRRLNKQRFGGVRVWFLPHPGLLGFHI